MVTYRSYNDLVISFLEFLRLVQPELDTKPGTVARDVFVDSPSQQIAEVYTQLRNISNLQSFFSSNGTDLARLASNFGVSKNQGSVATGIAVLTTNNLEVDILIESGSIIIANNGVNFRVVNNSLMSSSNSNVYRATANRYRTQLDLASITDQYAIEVTVEALTTGTSGNIGPYSLLTQSISGISNVTNFDSFSGGSSQESDDEFRSRLLSVFAGSNTGTALGYRSAVESISGVQDSVVIVPGDPLLVRDGTQVATDSDGNLIVSDPGTGGKVDIYVLGSQLESQIETFIYNDQSGNNDPTSPTNDVILGQRGQDTTLNIAQRRVTLINSGTLPYQPVESIVSVTGSSSGPNFVEKYTDSQGRIRGNYELVKDTGDYGGSLFGFDRLRWTSDTIELDDEESVKGTFNGVDELDYSDVQKIREITQDYLVTNENSSSSASKRSEVTLKHTPVRTVSRVVNLTTGERYVIENQNPDGTAGALNTSGKITISGSTLPVSTDILQVDYTWVKSFDRVFDFDNLEISNINRTAQDSVDWGFSNLVTNEKSTVTTDASGNLVATVTHPIYKIINVNTFSTDIATVNNGIVTLNNTVSNIVDMKRVSDNAEIYNTDSMDGTLSGSTSVILPTDTLAKDGDIVTVRFNSTNIYSADAYQSGSSFLGNTVILPSGSVNSGTEVLVNYIANVSVLLPETDMANLPATKSGNKFLINTSYLGNQPVSNLFDNNDQVIQNLRTAPSNARITVGNIASSGSISLLGTTIWKLTDVLVTVTSGTGYEVDLQQSILDNSNFSSLSSNIKVVKLHSLERVNVNSSGVITSVDNVYDIINYSLKDNSYDTENALSDTSLNNTKIVLPQTYDNTNALLNTGDIVRVTFYYVNSNDSELVYFSKNGEQISDKKFTTISKVYINSGFRNAAGQISGNIIMKNFNQPVENSSSYFVDYDYTAPKENERITATFNYNSLINDATLGIEDVRPITADVLVKAAASVDINVSIRIIISEEYQDQSQTVLEDATEAVTSLLSANSLGTTIDSSDVINALYSVQGIDRVRILTFGYSGGGNVLSITASRNKYLNAGTISITTEER